MYQTKLEEHTEHNMYGSKKMQGKKMMDIEKTNKRKMKPAPVSPKQKKLDLQRAMLKKNYLKSGKKK
jgi:hypothetical protein